jgi:hypothetical protein
MLPKSGSKRSSKPVTLPVRQKLRRDFEGPNQGAESDCIREWPIVARMRSIYFCCGAMWTSSNCWPDSSEAQRGLDVVLRDRVMVEGPGDYCGGGGSGEIHFI